MRARARPIASLAFGLAVLSLPPHACVQVSAQTASGALATRPFAAIRPRIEALLGPDQLDAIYSIATTADARIRSTLEGVRSREGVFRNIRGDRARVQRWHRAAFGELAPIWEESARQIDALLTPQQVAQLQSERDRFRLGHPRIRESDPPLPGGYGGIAAARSSDVGGFVLRALLGARAPE